MQRRLFCAGLIGLLTGCGPAARRSVETTVTRVDDTLPSPPEPVDWESFVDEIGLGAIVISLTDRRLAYWGRGGIGYREFPVAIPVSPEFERLGETRIVGRRADPSWRPTPDMRRRNPDLPDYVPPGPDNPLGPYAIYLGWTYYAIHGTNNDASIGRRATSGCFRLFDDHIAWLFENAARGAPVVVIADSLRG